MNELPLQGEHLPDGGKEMSLMEHLDELRSALIKSIIAVLVIFVIAISFSNYIINFVKIPLMESLPETQRTLHFTGPMDVFIASLKVSFLCSLVLSCPVWSYQFWRFLEPGLYPTEKKLVIPFATASMLLFFAGVAFCYYVMLPMALQFLIGMGLEVGTPIITINDYISLVTILTFAFGLVFETPVVLVLLGVLGLIDAQTLSKQRPVIVVFILVVAAILTPPDPVSQIAMAIPMYVLFEISILILRLIGRPRKSSSALDKPAGH